MSKLSYLSIILTIMLMLLGLNQSTIFAATQLPASNWYAMTYVPVTDSLHWVNAQGEQGALERPHLTNEATNPGILQMEISPNGQYMVLIVSLNNNILGIGFYNFASGQFVQVHEAQPHEVLIAHSKLEFSFTGSHFVMALRNTLSKEWRVIVFETATGNAVDQLTRNSQILPDTFITHPSYYPFVSHFNVDEGIGQQFVGLQLVNDDSTMTAFPSFNWYHNPVPAIADAPIVPASLPYSPFAGHDVLRTTKAIAFTGFNGQGATSNIMGNAISTQFSVNQLPSNLVNGTDFILRSPQWLKNGEWIGYRVQGGAYQPHNVITSAQSDTSLPLGPNIGSIHSTPDGVVAVNVLDWQLYHLTDTVNVDAFASQFGNTIFQSNGLQFSVIYTTPENSLFSLTSIPTDAQLNVPLGGNNEVQAPEQTCGTAPATRLTVGESARVTFTDGTDLNIRTAPAGDYIMQIAEGTVVNVVSGAVCADNYFWWQIQFDSQGVTVGGWAAEGTPDQYFLEPYTVALDDPLQFVPTATPMELIVVTLQPTVELEVIEPLEFAPTNTPELQVINPMEFAPTNTPQPLVIKADCLKSPSSQLQIGMSAKTANLEGTFAMRTNLSDPYPSNQVPPNHPVQIIDGYQCREGFRMWQVSTNLNGHQVVGWLAEGFNSTYYVMPQ